MPGLTAAAADPGLSPGTAWPCASGDFPLSNFRPVWWEEAQPAVTYMASRIGSAGRGGQDPTPGPALLPSAQSSQQAVFGSWGIC